MKTEDILNARLNGLGHWTGNTPLLAIDLSFDGERRVIYAKAENLNMTGSIKDRMALSHPPARLRAGHPQAGGDDHRGDERQHRHRLRGLRTGPRAPRDHLHARLDEPGAQRPHPQPRRPDPPRQSRRKAGSWAASGSPRSSPPRSKARSCRASSPTRTTSTPIIGRPGPRSGGSSACSGLRPDAFIAGVGTGGTIMGTGRFLQAEEPAVKLYPARALQLADDVHRPQGREAPHPGHLRRVHSPDRRLGQARPRRRRRRRRRDPHGPEARRRDSAWAWASPPARTSWAR